MSGEVRASETPGRHGCGRLEPRLSFLSVFLMRRIKKALNWGLRGGWHVRHWGRPEGADEPNVPICGLPLK
jgi:hypothetical protein